MSQSNRGKYYAKKEKKMLRNQGVYSRFDTQQSELNVGIFFYTYLLKFPL